MAPSSYYWMISFMYLVVSGLRRIGTGEEKICPALRLTISDGAEKKDNPGNGSEIAAFELLDPCYQVLQFGIGDLDLAFNGIYLIQQLPYPHVHQIDDELLDYDDTSEQYQHKFFICHECSKNGIT